MPVLDIKLQTTADAALTTLVDALSARQAGVRGRTGRYRQCVRDTSWVTWDAYKPDATIVVVWVDEFLSPDGPGWVVMGEVTDQGVVYRKAIVFGPEQWRTHDWLPVAPMAERAAK